MRAVTHPGPFLDGDGLYGFCYVPSTDDYKVVKVEYKDDDDDCGESLSLARVYSTKTNAWKRVHGFRYVMRLLRHGPAHLNGAAHWLADDFDSRSVIVRFNFAHEMFDEMPLPDDVKLGCMDLLGNLAALLCVSLENGSGRCFEVWAMNDYGAREFWTMSFRIPNYAGQGVISHIFPLSCVGDTVLLQINGSCLLKYDKIRGKFEKLELPFSSGAFGMSECEESYMGGQFTVTVYEESIISPCSRIAEDEFVPNKKPKI